MYGRGDQAWIRLNANASDGIVILNGFNDKKEIDEEDLLTFNPYVISRDPEAKTTSKILSFKMDKDSYVWFCCTNPLSDIQVQLQDGVTTKSDYVDAGTKQISETGQSFYCYRLTDKIIKDYLWTFVLTIDLQ